MGKSFSVSVFGAIANDIFTNAYGYTGQTNVASIIINHISLYKYIGEIAPGSYGILYVKDDEDINGFDNEFIVYVLVRGRVNQNKDKFLSPFIPIVEDEYTG